MSGGKTIDKGLYLKRKFEAFPDKNTDAENCKMRNLKRQNKPLQQEKKLLSMNIEKVIAFIKHVKQLELH
ncbi:hypothetical protein [Saccharococcus caldoxylosilyticus]|jgi:hypothetical protein|uniref:Uncharacterized protein n=1 Tax=Saccharococcus caldoxylosilyticus TaxID=81408 RepID=A0A150L4L2_9BACL|nr:hypothetical protein [Parageobacillus caldoxylosilyticus]KYD06622.1 hypothetical protein B4119_1960 [Parageobacillus caldoxylosilyticus]